MTIKYRRKNGILSSYSEFIINLPKDASISIRNVKSAGLILDFRIAFCQQFVPA